MMKLKKRKRAKKLKIPRGTMSRQSSSHKWKSMLEFKLKIKKKMMLSYHQRKERLRKRLKKRRKIKRRKKIL